MILFTVEKICVMEDKLKKISRNSTFKFVEKMQKDFSGSLMFFKALILLTSLVLTKNLKAQNN